MDERVEITNVPQPLLPHPDAPLLAHADAYPKAGEAETVHQARRNATRLWAALPFICVIVGLACLLLGLFNITPLGYTFDSHISPRPLGWATIILVYSSVVFSIISCVMAVGLDESMPNRRDYIIVGCISMFISVVAALLLTVALVLGPIIATLL